MLTNHATSVKICRLKRLDEGGTRLFGVGVARGGACSTKCHRLPCPFRAHAALWWCHVACVDRLCDASRETVKRVVGIEVKRVQIRIPSNLNRPERTRHGLEAHTGSLRAPAGKPTGAIGKRASGARPQGLTYWVCDLA